MDQQSDSIFLDVWAPLWLTDPTAPIEEPHLVTDLDSALTSPTVARLMIEQQSAAVATVEPAPWTYGLVGESRETTIGNHPGIVAILTAVVLLLMLSYNNCRRLFQNMAHELWGMRKRQNAFDERTTNETRTLAVLALQWSVSVGILLYCALQGRVNIDPFYALLWLIAIAAGYYLAQLCTYFVVGYTFTSRAGCRYFIEGFTASQAFLGLALLLPSMAAIFYPQYSLLMVKIGAVLYICARIIFISKGFRIFYQNFGSLLYFILYLCTLEIIPLFLVYNFALNLVSVSTV